MWLFLILLAVPVIEIALFITVGDVIGIWWTIAAVILTAIAGTLALRAQGAQMMNRARQAMHAPQDMPDVLGEGLLLFASGLLLLTPGFLTDAIGALLLFPPTRRVVWRLIARNAAVHVAGATFSHGPAHGPGAESHPQYEDPANQPQSSDFPDPRAPQRRPAAGPGDQRQADVEDAVILDSRSGPTQND